MAGTFGNVQSDSEKAELTGLFVCFPCKTIEEISHYIPAQADTDTRIGFLIENHLRRHPSFEDRLITDWASLGSVPTKYYADANYKKDITTKILEGNGLTGFDSETYATMDFFKEEALKCFVKHRRPNLRQGQGCNDFMTVGKELKPNTAVERRVAGLPKYDDVKVKRRFLCEHCPYMSTIPTR